MAYSELIKNFSRIRDYMREFYVYGFKSRDEFCRKSPRSYDDERRRIESWLGDYMQFRRASDGKSMFLSIDSRFSHHNPLFKAWKAKSFTDGDITLHFILLDILCSPEISLPLGEITHRIDDYLLSFSSPRFFDESTVRKKLKEYISEGIIIGEKQGKTMYYRRSENAWHYNKEMLDFFSEISPLGVIGSFLLDREEESERLIAFKHITSVLDSEIQYELFSAMREKKAVSLELLSRREKNKIEECVIPLRIYASAQNGRQYLMSYLPRLRRFSSFRTDYIVSVKTGEVCDDFDKLREKLWDMRKNMWGVSVQSHSGQRMERVEFTVRYDQSEQYIHQRLEREKRCGIVEKIDENTSRFSAEVFDAGELFPWIRTFICRITDISFSDKSSEERFKSDLREMYSLYGIEEAEAE